MCALKTLERWEAEMGRSTIPITLVLSGDGRDLVSVWHVLSTESFGASGDSFGSYHPGVCQFVYGDGHVKALSSTIDSELLGYLAVRDDGNILAGDDLR